MKAWAKGLITLIVLLALGVLAYRMYDKAPEPVAYTTPAETYTTPAYTTPAATSTPVATTSDMIRVTTPVRNALVASPLVISGSARGTWYFEASFPVKILDANGKVLAQAPAQAQGEWMTTSFVPFSLSLPFATSTTATGTLVLMKDNPSGLPENDAEVRIPIRFR